MPDRRLERESRCSLSDIAPPKDNISVFIVLWPLKAGVVYVAYSSSSVHLLIQSCSSDLAHSLEACETLMLRLTYLATVLM